MARRPVLLLIGRNDRDGRPPGSARSAAHDAAPRALTAPLSIAQNRQTVVPGSVPVSGVTDVSVGGVYVVHGSG
jgi:hypothetical protein